MATFTIRAQTFTAPVLEPALYIVATPIGNLGDITLRALDVLAGADVIACEDTRTTGVLLSRYGIGTDKVSYTEHNADNRGPDLLRQIGEGRAVALVSDAGTPLVSDPGARLVAAAVDAGVVVVPIPGAAAPVSALVGSGLSDGDFRFCGFLPSKAKARADRLEVLSTDDATLVFFESPARIADSVAAMRDAFGDRPATVAREMTKLHETFHRGTLSALQTEFASMERVRGEIVVVVSGAQADAMSDADVDAALQVALASMRTKDAAAHVADLTGRSKSDLYARALELKS